MMDASGPGAQASGPEHPPAPRERVRPVDPRLLRYASASRRFFVVIALISAAQTAVIVAFAWLLTRAIVGAVERMPGAELAPILAALALVVVARSLLLWAREIVAARFSAAVRAEERACELQSAATLWYAGSMPSPHSGQSGLPPETPHSLPSPQATASTRSRPTLGATSRNSCKQSSQRR